MIIKNKSFAWSDGLNDIQCYDYVRKNEGEVLPYGFWSEKVAIKLIRYLCLHIYKMSRDDLCINMSRKFLIENKLRSALKFFNESPYNVVKACFPEFDIKPWELNSCPTNFYDSKKNCIEIMKWIAKKEGIHRDSKKFCMKMNRELFEKYGVSRAVKRMGGLYNYIETVYPGRYKPWDFNIYRINDELVIMATKWMIEEKLNWSVEDVCKNISAQIFYDNGIGSILCHGCNHSPIIALQKAYPGIYTREMLVKGLNNPFKK